MRLMHYREVEIALDRERAYEQRPPYSTFDKPDGFWVSVEGEYDWPTWCRGSGYRTECLAVPHEVTLDEEANILILRTHDEALAFYKEYATTSQPPPWSFRSESGIDWPRVAQDYAGIIVAEWLYLWNDARMSWLYTWDCTSGCIWDLSAITSVDVAVKA